MTGTEKEAQTMSIQYRGVDIDPSPYTVLRIEHIPCTTDQGNFPHARNMPWARDGICSICNQPVATQRVGPDNPNLYSHIAHPHVRKATWYALQDHELFDLLAAEAWG